MKRLIISSVVLAGFDAAANVPIQNRDPISFEQSAVDIKQFSSMAFDDNTKKDISPVLTVSDTNQQINQAILLKQWDVLAALLSDYPNQAQFDPILYHYAAAALSYAKGQHGDAIYHYEQVLSLDPSLTYSRFDLALILFEDKQFDAARQQFQLAYGRLDPQMRTVTQSYLQAIDEAQSWRTDFYLQYTQTNNVNNVSPSRVVNINGRQFIKSEDSLPQSAHGFNYGVDIERDINLHGHHFLSSAVKFGGVYYWDNQEYNEQTLHFALGYRYKNARQTFGVLPFAEQNWFGHSRYNKQFGVQLKHQYKWNQRWQSALNFNHYYKRYRDELTAWRYNSWQNEATGLLFWQPTGHWRLFGGLELNRENTKEKALSSHKIGGIGGLVYQAPLWGGMMTLRYSERHFEGKHYLYGYPRQDREYQSLISIWHEKISWKGILPKLNFKWQKIDSNIPDFYSRTNKSMFITLEKRF